MSTETSLKVILANTYALYLKTQNYHWHVKGIHFKSLHELFEEHYTELAEAIDEIAERLIILGFTAPATFKDLDGLKTIADGNSSNDAMSMLADLSDSHQTIINDINTLLASEVDEGTVALLGERISAHEKALWMLNASKA